MKKIILGLALTSLLAACTDPYRSSGSGSSSGNSNPNCCAGNGDGSAAGPEYGRYGHSALAELFVQELNLDPEFDVTLAKKSTLEENFLVIYDPYTDSYDALNINNYDPNYDNAADYYFANSARGFFNLERVDSHYIVDYEYVVLGIDIDGFDIWGYEEVETYVPTRYHDNVSGFVFEKVTASTKDLAKITAIKEAASVKKTAEFISSEFGLSLERASEVSGLRAHWKKAGVKGMTTAEVDRFSTELLGFSLTKGMSAYKRSIEGDTTSLQDLVDQSAALNGITPEHAGKLMTKVFGL